MLIHLSSTAQLELPAYRERGDIDIPEGTTIGKFFELSGVRKEHQGFIIPLVNGENRNRHYVLQNGDSLFLMVPVGGG